MLTRESHCFGKLVSLADVKAFRQQVGGVVVGGDVLKGDGSILDALSNEVAPNPDML